MCGRKKKNNNNNNSKPPDRFVNSADREKLEKKKKIGRVYYSHQRSAAAIVWVHRVEAISRVTHPRHLDEEEEEEEGAVGVRAYIYTAHTGGGSGCFGGEFDDPELPRHSPSLPLSLLPTFSSSFTVYMQAAAAAALLPFTRAAGVQPTHTTILACIYVCIYIAWKPARISRWLLGTRRVYVYIYRFCIYMCVNLGTAVWRLYNISGAFYVLRI